MSLWRKLSAASRGSRQQAPGSQHTVPSDPERVVAQLSRAAISYTALRARLVRRCSDTWLLAFLEHGGLQALFAGLGALSERGFAAFSDTVQQMECVRCIQALLNSHVGMDYILDTATAHTRQFAQALCSGNVLVKTQIVNMLACLCLYDGDGHTMVLNVLRSHKARCGHRQRFQFIVTEMKEACTVHSAYCSSILGLVNCLLKGAMESRARYNIHHQLNDCGMQKILAELRLMTDDDDIVIQLQAYDEDRDREADQDEDIYAGNVNLNSTKSIFTELHAKVRHTPNHQNFLNLLQHLLLIYKDTSFIDFRWELVARLTIKAVLADESSDLDEIVPLCVREVQHILQRQSQQLRGPQSQQDQLQHRARSPSRPPSPTESTLRDLSSDERRSSARKVFAPARQIASPAPTAAAVSAASAAMAMAPAAAAAAATSAAAAAAAAATASGIPRLALTTPVRSAASSKSPFQNSPHASPAWHHHKSKVSPAVAAKQQVLLSSKSGPLGLQLLTNSPNSELSTGIPTSFPSTVYQNSPPISPLAQEDIFVLCDDEGDEGDEGGAAEIAGSSLRETARLPPPPSDSADMMLLPPPDPEIIADRSMPDASQAPPLPALPPPPPPPPLPVFLSASTHGAHGAHDAHGPIGTTAGVPASFPQPNKRMKKLNWNRIAPQRVGSTSTGQDNLWKKISLSDSMENGTLDFQHLESFFSQAEFPSGSEAATPGGKGRQDISTSPATVVTLLDTKSSLNASIFLKQFKFSLPCLVKIIEDGDTAKLDIDQLRVLLQLLPDRDTMEMLERFSGATSKLGEAEKFFLLLHELPDYRLCIECMQLRLDFKAMVESVQPTIDWLQEAGKEAMSSNLLTEVFALVLSMGNFMNYGGLGGNAAGFQLSSLLKLDDTRANCSRMTLMHYLLESIEKKRPELLKLPEQLSSLNKASTVSISQITSQVNALATRLERVQTSLSTTVKQLQSQMAEFLDKAKSTIAELKENLAKVRVLEQNMATYFSESQDTFRLDTTVDLLAKFSQRFEDAYRENVRRREAEERARELRKKREEARKSGKYKGQNAAAAAEEGTCIIDSLMEEIRLGYHLQSNPVRRDSMKKAKMSRIDWSSQRYQSPRTLPAGNQVNLSRQASPSVRQPNIEEERLIEGELQEGHGNNPEPVKRTLMPDYVPRSNLQFDPDKAAKADRAGGDQASLGKGAARSNPSDQSGRAKDAQLRVGTVKTNTSRGRTHSLYSPTSKRKTNPGDEKVKTSGYIPGSKAEAKRYRQTSKPMGGTDPRDGQDHGHRTRAGHDAANKAGPYDSFEPFTRTYSEGKGRVKSSRHAHRLGRLPFPREPQKHSSEVKGATACGEVDLSSSAPSALFAANRSYKAHPDSRIPSADPSSPPPRLEKGKQFEDFTDAAASSGNFARRVEAFTKPAKPVLIDQHSSSTLRVVTSRLFNALRRRPSTETAPDPPVTAADASVDDTCLAVDDLPGSPKGKRNQLAQALPHPGHADTQV